MHTLTPAEALDPRQRMEPNETRQTGTDNLNEAESMDAGLDNVQDDEEDLDDTDDVDDVDDDKEE